MPRSATRWAEARGVSRLRAAGALAALVLAAGCAGARVVGETTTERERPGAVESVSGPLVRVALATAAPKVELGSGGEWRLTSARGSVLARGASGERWTVERRGRLMRAVRVDGRASAWAEGPLAARAADANGTVSHGARRYRGEIVLTASDSGIMVVNWLPVEDYLAGVVPLEIGNRSAAERAAAEAQAVAARSYTHARLRESAGAPYDLRPTTSDQVYGGADAEREVTTQAVRATAGLVLLYGGRLVSAPYHSTCGGSTAAPDEVWRARAEPHLRAVSDLVPGSRDRYYCDAAPRFAWSRTLEQDELRRLMERYLASYAPVPAGGVGTVRELRVVATTSSGRVGELEIGTSRGTFRLRGNDARYVLRSPGGEILNSTYFTVRRPPVRRGESSPVATIEGRGYGHGVGMCQWGAIGRARAGQDFRTILRTYYPGTSVGFLR
ncbi:MAG TPA: SpoIID/LytB domain-containing protein [Gemmatimonadaceae bacterium]|nr:SpoIID/LytB domain-containing protein [Gemmatimonadaceae bacterium]